MTRSLFDTVVESFRIITGDRTARRVVLGTVLAVVCVSALVPYLFRHAPAPEENAVNNPGLTFHTCAAAEVADEMEVLGQIVYYEKVAVSSKVTGRLEKIYVQEGKRVRKGEVIAQVERLPLELSLKQQAAECDIARTSLRLAVAKYENALKSIEIKFRSIEKAEAEVYDKLISFQNMDRMLKNKEVLLKMGGVSESEMASLKAQHTTLHTKYLLAGSDLAIQRVGYRDEDIITEGMAVPKTKKEKVELLKKINTKIERAEVEAAKARVTQAEKALESTQILLRETTLHAPITGVVASKNMEAGEMVKAESVIAIVVSIDRVFVSFNVSERELPALRTGQKLCFTVDALGDRPLTARIERFTPVLDPKTRTVEVKALLANPAHAMLPGMFARGKVLLGKKLKTILIPPAALIKKEKDRGELYLVKKGWFFSKKLNWAGSIPEVSLF